MAHAQQVLAGRQPPGVQRYALGPSLGQCCGGVVWLALERIGVAEADVWRTRAEAVAAGGTLPRRLLAFARRQPLPPSAVDVDVFIRDLADLIEYSVGQGVAVVLDLDAANVCAWVDRGQLENALLNLAINARDAMPNGGSLHLRSRFDANRDLVSIEVADSGQGMDREIRERVFEPFFTTKAGSGSGLGLSIV